MDSNWSVLAELFLGLVHLSDEVDKSLTGLGHALLGPVRKVELSDRARLAVLYAAHTHNHAGRRIYACSAPLVLRIAAVGTARIQVSRKISCKSVLSPAARLDEDNLKTNSRLSYDILSPEVTTL